MLIVRLIFCFMSSTKQVLEFHGRGVNMPGGHMTLVVVLVSSYRIYIYIYIYGTFYAILMLVKLYI